MNDEMEFDGVSFTAARRAAEESGLSRDYIGRLCKKGSVVGRRVGSGWYIDMRSLKGFLSAQEHLREFRRQSLVEKRSTEYRANRQSAQRVRLMPARDMLAVPQAASAVATDIHDRLRRALEEKTTPSLNVISDVSKNVPSGFTHATMQSMSAQALIHVPTYIVTPTLELVHKAVALATTFLIIGGIFTLFAPSQARYAYQSVQELAVAAQPAHLASELSVPVESTAAFVGAQSEKIQESLAYITAGTSAPSSASSPQTAAAAQSTSVAPMTENVAVQQAAAAASSLTVQSTTSTSSVKTASGTTTASFQPGGAIATAVTFTGTSVSYGDLVAHDPVTDVYTLTQGTNDPNEYGVVVQDPAILFKSGGATGTVPVLRSGSALVNVTLENGPIAAGDQLTSGSIPGKARRANAGEHVIGVAAEPFTGQGGVSLRAPDGTHVLSGTITVQTNSGSTAGGSSAPECGSLACRLLSGIDPALIRAFARYLLSGLIAVLALFFAFRSFMSEASYGVISMGRNPLAKNSIQSMVLLNAFLAMVIASAGLFAAIVVLFATN